MAEADKFEQQSRKLSVIIALLLRIMAKDSDPSTRKRGTTGEFAVFLKRHGHDHQDIANILDSPVASVRELVRRGTRKKRS